MEQIRDKLADTLDLAQYQPLNDALKSSLADLQLNRLSIHDQMSQDAQEEVLVNINVKAPLANSRINWVYDSPPSQSHHIAPRQNTPKSNNNVPRNCPIAQSSDVRMSAPRGNISRSVWRNSTLSFRSNNCPPVPRNNATNRQTDAQKIVSPPPKKKRINYKRRERRAREKSAREERDRKSRERRNV